MMDERRSGLWQFANSLHRLVRNWNMVKQKTSLRIL